MAYTVPTQLPTRLPPHRQLRKDSRAAAQNLINPPQQATNIQACRQWRQRYILNSCCQATAIDNEDSSLPLLDLKDRLELAIRAEDYKAAANLRDELQRRQADARSAVEEVNRRFYRAFEAGDMKAMEEVWGQGEHVQVLHPGTPCIAGHEDVLESWRLITRSNRGMKIQLEDIRIYATDNEAFLTCVEVIDTQDVRGRTVATNIFERQAGCWVLILHQGGPLPR